MKFIFSPNAEIAQMVECNLAKVEVAGPSPVFRSKKAFQISGGPISCADLCQMKPS